MLAVLRCSPGGNWNPPTNGVWAGLAPQGAPLSPPAALGVDGVSEQTWASQHFVTSCSQTGVVANADRKGFQRVKAKELSFFSALFSLMVRRQRREGTLLWKSRMTFLVLSLKNKVIILHIVSDLVNRVPVMAPSSLPWGQGWLCHSQIMMMVLSWVEARSCVFWGWSLSSPSQVCLWRIPGCSYSWVVVRPAPRSAGLTVWQAWSPENGSCNPKKKVTVHVVIAFPEIFFPFFWSSRELRGAWDVSCEA